MNKDCFVRANQEKAIELLIEILDIDRKEETRVQETIKEIGIKDFLFNIDTLDFSDEVKERVKALSEIVQIEHDRIQRVYSEGGKQDDK